MFHLWLTFGARFLNLIFHLWLTFGARLLYDTGSSRFVGSRSST